MNEPSVSEIVGAAIEKLEQHGKKCRGYKLIIWRQQIVCMDTKQLPDGPMWHLEYHGVSFLQPALIVRAIMPDGLLKRFEEELAVFEPIMLSELELLNKKKTEV